MRSVLSVRNQVKTAQSQPSTSDGVNRRLQLLIKQRQRLEAQTRELEAEILEMASLRLSRVFVPLTGTKEADQKRRQ